MTLGIAVGVSLQVLISGRLGRGRKFREAPTVNPCKCAQSILLLQIPLSPIPKSCKMGRQKSSRCSTQEKVHSCAPNPSSSSSKRRRRFGDSPPSAFAELRFNCPPSQAHRRTKTTLCILGAASNDSSVSIFPNSSYSSINCRDCHSPQGNGRDLARNDLSDEPHNIFEVTRGSQKLATRAARPRRISVLFNVNRKAQAQLGAKSGPSWRFT